MDEFGKAINGLEQVATAASLGQRRWGGEVPPGGRGGLEQVATAASLAPVAWATAVGGEVPD